MFNAIPRLRDVPLAGLIFLPEGFGWVVVFAFFVAFAVDAFVRKTAAGRPLTMRHSMHSGQFCIAGPVKNAR
jgi:hypothetical protein